MRSDVFNMDCLEAMRQMSDKQFDLAIVDPPYGIDRDGHDGVVSSGWKKHEWKGWDRALPEVEYFTELRRVSANQIVWGGNYFTPYLPSSMGWICWYKGQEGLTMSDCELAYSSFNRATRHKTFFRLALIKDGVIHPTQKPVALYKWLLTNYAKPGDTILDTHLGSGSSRIAAYDLGFDFTGYELDKDYFEAQEKRFANHIAQPKLFEAPAPVQLTLEAAA